MYPLAYCPMLGNLEQKKPVTSDTGGYKADPLMHASHFVHIENAIHANENATQFLHNYKSDANASPSV